MTMKIAISNQKGGVGKTTVTINLAGALAERGHEVLVMDLDPQGHATEGLGLADEYEADAPHFGTVLSELEQTDQIGATIRDHQEVDIVPSNIDMFIIETDLTGAMRSRERLSLAFEALDGRYDFVLVDAPPSLGHLTDNALLACGNVLIPALAEGTSIRALEILFDQITTLEKGYDAEIATLGLVANRVEQDGEATEMMEWFESAVGDRMPVWEVRKRVAIKRAWNNGVSIFSHDEECDMERVFDEIAASMEDVDE
jgi:chromosome partitioning protein